MREPTLTGTQFDAMCHDLAEMTGHLEDGDVWPGAQFQRLGEAGVLGWVIPQEYGGAAIGPEALMSGYMRLSAACLVTAFVLTQRNAACQRIANSENEELKADLLPELCGSDRFATVGVSHLTTSRQHLRRPAVEVRETDSGFVLDGTVPWVTGARFADVVVTGGTCDDGRQVLIALPMDREGITLKEPPPLLALNASQTGSVQVDGVEVERHDLIAGPMEGVMKRGKGGGAGSLTTSSLALGAAAGALERLGVEAEQRPDLRDTYDPMVREQTEISDDLFAAARSEPADDRPNLTPESIRQRANSLVLRSTQAYLAASKGAGFVKGHPAERMVREAMFFLVWSCPQPVLNAALREFACVLQP